MSALPFNRGLSDREAAARHVDSSRRDFLKTSAAAFVAPTLGGPLIFTQDGSDNGNDTSANVVGAMNNVGIKPPVPNDAGLTAVTTRFTAGHGTTRRSHRLTRISVVLLPAVAALSLAAGSVAAQTSEKPLTVEAIYGHGPLIGPIPTS